MANRIKGITVEIGGDTTGLDKALKGVNSNIKDTQSQLKDVERLLKLDPKNTELLAQKQKLLGQTIANTKTKLEGLKQANDQVSQSAQNYDSWKEKYDPIKTEIDKTKKKLSELKDISKEADQQLSNGKISQDQYDALQSSIKVTEDKLKGLKEQAIAVGDEFGNPISTKQYDALQREIIATENDLKKFKSALDDTGNAASDMGDAAEKAGKSAESSAGHWTVLKGVLANLISSGIQALVGKLAGLVSALAELPLSTREYRTEMAKLDTAFKNAGFTANDATKTYKSLYSVVGETDQATEAANLMANLSTSEGDLTKWTNILTGAFGTYGDSMPIESLMEAASETAKTGTVTGAFADALNWSSDAAKMFSGYMGGDVKTAEDAFNVALSECSTEQERNALITETMTKLYGGASDQYKETSASIIAANEANANLEESQARLGETLEPLQTAWTNFKAKALDALRPVLENLAKNVFPSIQDAMKNMDWSAVSSAIGDIASSVADFIGGKIQDAPDIISGIKGNLEDFWNTAKNVASTIGSIISVIINIAPVLAVVVPAIMAVKVAIGLVNAIMAINTAIMLTNPAVLVIAAIAGLVAAFIALWINCEEFRNFWIGLWDGIKSVFSAVVSAVQTGISAIAGFFMTLFGKIATIVGSIRTAISTAFKSIKSTITSIMDKVKSVITSIWYEIKSVITTVVNGIKSKVSGAFNGLKSTVSNIFNGIKSTATNVWNGIKSAITKPVEAAKDAVKGIIDKIKGFFNFSWSLPKLKVPKFSIEPPGWEIGDLLKGSIPHLSVVWHKKAMNNPMLLDRPTIFGAAGNSLLAGGEAGSEVVSGAETLMHMIQSAVSKESTAQTQVLVNILSAIKSGDAKVANAIMSGSTYVYDRRELARAVKSLV